MAREIVITSVPRGVKLGRTGFQVAMQTAGLRDDLASQLEKMAGYRHLPTGVPNPVCYFHRLTKTFAGQVSVLGRIVDAGVDFSNRSNKLAHMVALEAADMGQVGSSSPAAALAAIEGRLASTWPGPPEERQSPFALAGIPASQAARCGLWQQVAGDAGWAGVLAERAVRGQPTLVIGPDSSPASCRRMLALFQEALAIVPQQKRWSVTFDTTSLSPEGVLWRGTYAGSPESQVAQPGVLVIDLTRPQPIPQNLAAGDLVKIAREGPPAPVTTRPPGPTTGTTAPPVPGHGSQRAAGGEGGPMTGGLPIPPTAPGGGGPGKLAPIGGSEWDGVPAGQRRKKRSYGGLIAGGIAIAAVLMLALGAVAAWVIWPSMSQRWALNRFNNYAQDRKNPPTGADLKAALRVPDEELSDEQANAAVVFLNGWLASDKPIEARTHAVHSAEELRKLLELVQMVMQPAGDQKRFSEAIKALCLTGHERAFNLVATKHTTGFSDWRNLSQAVKDASASCTTEDLAFEKIKRYAAEKDIKDRPDKKTYQDGLRLASDPGPAADTWSTFLTDFLASKDDASKHVESVEQLNEIWQAVEAACADRPKEGRKGLGLLVGKENEEVVPLLDAIHPKPFKDYASLREVAHNLVSLKGVAASEDRVEAVLGENLLAALIDRDASLKERMAKVKDPDGKVFVKQVQQEDFGSRDQFVAALDRVYPPPKNQEKPVEQNLPFDKLREEIRKFRREVNNGKKDYGKLLAEQGKVDLFRAYQDVVVRVARCKEFETDINGGRILIGSDEVMKVIPGAALTVEKGAQWDRHKEVAGFLPIGFARTGGDPVEADDWIVLSPPAVDDMPSESPTLHDLMFASDPVEVSLPRGIKRGSATLKLSKKTINDLGGPLTVELQVDPSGNHGVVKITAAIKTATVDDKTEDIKYTLTERIGLASGKVSRLSRGRWDESRSRMMLLKRDHDHDAPKDKELSYVGFKAVSGNKESALRDLTQKMLESVAQATASGRSATSKPFRAAEEHVEQWSSGDGKPPSTLSGWRDHLRDWLAKQPNGFASECRTNYERRNPRPEDPGQFEEPRQDDKEDKDDFRIRRQGLIQAHEAKKEALVTHDQDVRTDFDAQVRDLEVLRKYVEAKCDPKNRGEISAEVAAVCFLLEIDGLIVAKVYREELVGVLKRIPVTMFVQGDVEPREWDAWVASGVRSQIDGKKRVHVRERRLQPATKLLEPPAELPADQSIPPAQGDAAGGQAAEEAQERSEAVSK